MARTKGMLNLSGNLEVNAGAPLDARTVVPTLADLTVASNFQYKYVGMPVVVQATGDMYILTANDVTVAANWKQVGSGGGGSSYTAGDGIDITNDEISVKAGSNLSFDSSGNLNATDTTYTAGDGIVIDNDEISTDNMPAADMSEIVTPLPSVMSRLPRYSTEEQIVGYWIDNKPLYQKTFELTNVTEWSAISLGLANIDMITKKDSGYGILSNGDLIGEHGFFESASTKSYFTVMVYKTSNNQPNVYITESATGSLTKVVITVLYTKTTDTPV